MIILGYICASLVGVSLGLIGAGGSILILPILVYFLGVNASLATGYSLLIVGLTSVVGALKYHKQNLVDMRTVLIFGFPSFVGVFTARMFVLPRIPEVLYDGMFVLHKDQFILAMFSAVMFVTALFMIKKDLPFLEESDVKNIRKKPYMLAVVATEGFVVGNITGLVGAGGGFLIIPALVILARMPMKMAIGTSLAIIAVKSLLGVLGDYSRFESYDWQLILLFSLVSICGIYGGSIFSKHISAERLKPIFGYFVLLMALYIIGKEIQTIFF